MAENGKVGAASSGTCVGTGKSNTTKVTEATAATWAEEDCSDCLGGGV